MSVEFYNYGKEVTSYAFMRCSLEPMASAIDYPYNSPQLMQDKVTRSCLNDMEIGMVPDPSLTWGSWRSALECIDLFRDVHPSELLFKITVGGSTQGLGWVETAFSYDSD